MDKYSTVEKQLAFIRAELAKRPYLAEIEYDDDLGYRRRVRINLNHIADADYGTSTIPRTGMLTEQGAAVSCDALRAGTLTGLKLRGVIGAFGATGTGDALEELFFDCQ